jgi:ribonucleoside-diphosphate reductase alpha chain
MNSVQDLETRAGGSGEGARTYSFEEASEETTRYFGGDSLAGSTWVKKYALKDSDGKIYESNPDQMHWRIANEISRIETKKGYSDPLSAERVHSLLKDFRYIVPQGSPASGIGNEHQVVSLSNCFVIGNDADSYGGILQTDQEQVQLMKRRGGVGHDLSHIRPSRSRVKNSALTSTGIVPFMERYSNSTREVAQDGRRGALMLSISIRHPDAEDFIDAKMTEGRATGANISVRIDDEFMKAVEGGTQYVQRYPVDSENPSFERKIDARDLWGKIIHNAWASAEPGVLFWDTIKRESVPDCYSDLGFETTSTNPCGEIPLCPYDSCRLLAINLFGHVENPFTDGVKFNTELFRENVHYAQRIMDDIVDLEIEKIDDILEKIESDSEPDEIKAVERNLWEKIRKKAVTGRRTGIGITGEGDMLATLGITYGSDESIEFSTDVHRTMALETYRASVDMAKERGAFSIYDPEKEKGNPFIERLREADPELVEDMEKYGRRNIALLTIAPTGTTSMMTQTTSGLEQVFKPVYVRNRKVNPNDDDVEVAFVDEVGDSWEEFTVFHHGFEQWLEIQGYDVEEIKGYSDEELVGIVEQSPYHNATSEGVDWLAKVRLQGSIQRWVDHSISVTVNLPKGTSEELVDKVYRTAWKEGCKGITIYVDGSRSGVLVSRDEKKDEITRKELSDLVMAQLEKPRPRGGKIRGTTEKVSTPFGEAFVTFNSEVEDGERHPYELFLSLGKAGGDMSAITEGIGRLISAGLRAGISPGYISDQLKGIGGETRKGIGPEKVMSLPDGIAKGIEKILSFDSDFNSEGEKDSDNGKSTGNFCPECGGGLIFQEGCMKCLSCGHSKCG